MLPKELKERLEAEIKSVEHPRELAVDVMFAVQAHYGYLSDAALAEAAALLGMTALSWTNSPPFTPSPSGSRWENTSSTCATASCAG